MQNATTENKHSPKVILEKIIDDVNGRVAVPILLYMLGAPLGLVILLWFFFFRGK